jgi:hypothetical protein
MASTCSQPIAHASIVELGFQFSKPPPSSDASRLGCAARFNLSAMDLPASINGRPFQAPRAVDELLLSACAADLSKEREIFDSDDDDTLSSPSRIRAPPEPSKQVDLTRDDDGDNEGGDSDYTEVSWHRTTRTTQHRVRLIPPSLTDRIQVTNQLRFPLTALSATVTYIHYRRLHIVV